MNLQSVQDKVGAALATGANVIGTVVQWKIPAAMSLRFSELESLLAKGFDDDMLASCMPKKITQKKSFTRAIQLQNAKKKTTVGVVREFKKLKVPTPGSICYGLCETTADPDAREFSLENEGWVALVDSEVRSNDATIKEKIENEMTQYLGSNEIRGFLARWARHWEGFATRQGGGSYIVPNFGKGFEKEAELLEGIIGANIPNGHLMLLPIIGGEHAKKNVTKAFNESIMAEIERFSKDVEEFFTSTTKKQKGATLKRLDEVKHLRKFALSYEGLLGPVLEDLTKKLDQLDTYVEKAVASALEDKQDPEAETEVETEAVIVADPLEPTDADISEFLKELDNSADEVV